MEQNAIGEQTLSKSVHKKLLSFPFFIFIILVLVCMGGMYWFFSIRKTASFPENKMNDQRNLSDTSRGEDEFSGSTEYLRILSLAGNSSRATKVQNKEGFDVCGYSEVQINTFMDIAGLKNWENTEWSPGCKYLYFVASLGNDQKGKWLYERADKRMIKLPNYEFFGFVNDNVMLSDGLDERVSYRWEGYKLFDIQNSRITADIGLANIRFRNPLFPWSFYYGSTWTFLPEESESENGNYIKVIFKIADWSESLHRDRVESDSLSAGVLTSSRTERPASQMKIAFYSYVPEFDKEKYRGDPYIIYNKQAQEIFRYIRYYPNTPDSSSDTIVNCDQWFISEDPNKAPAAVRISNIASEKDCLYDITVKIVNVWIYDNEFDFVKEF